MKLNPPNPTKTTGQQWNERLIQKAEEMLQISDQFRLLHEPVRTAVPQISEKKHQNKRFNPIASSPTDDSIAAK